MGDNTEGTPLTFDEILADKEYQSEFDKRISKAIDTAKSNWETTNKLEVEKFTGLETENATLKGELSKLKTQNEISASEVKKEFTEFVTEKVMGMVNENTDLKTALENYKKDNPQFFGETVVKKMQSSPNLNGGGAPPITTNSIMNEVLRNARK